MSRGRLTVLSALRSELPRGASVLLAVSGGADSVALAHAAASIAKGMKLNIAIAHIDHGLRPGSRADADWVSNFSASIGAKCFVRRLTAAPTTNIEAWARKERYKKLQSIRSRGGFDWIVTAHSANDVAETLLMRLVSNKELGSIESHDSRRCLIRPLLSITRAEILRYLERNSLSHREDPSNLSERFLRNRIRHNILPHFIREFGDGVVQSLAWEAQRAQDDLGVLRNLSRAHSKALSGITFGTREWLDRLRETLKLVPPPVRLRMIDAMFSPLCQLQLGVRHRARVLEFIETQRTSVQLPGGIVLKRRGGGLEIVTPQR